jgi:DNA-directed RNA polymerase subunit RPC12/RpoP
MSFIVWSRKCRKCKGQFYLEESEDGTYLVCIQCGNNELIKDEELATLLSAIQPAKKHELTRVI